MKRKTFSIPCQDDTCPKLAKVIEHYAAVAFPPGSSECSLLTKAALMDLAKRVAASEESVEMAVRQRAMLKAAIKWYFSEIEPSEDLQKRFLAYLARK